jgi:hypothetical protein
MIAVVVLLSVHTRCITCIASIACDCMRLRKLSIANGQTGFAHGHRVYTHQCERHHAHAVGPPAGLLEHEQLHTDLCVDSGPSDMCTIDSSTSEPTFIRDIDDVHMLPVCIASRHGSGHTSGLRGPAGSGWPKLRRGAAGPGSPRHGRVTAHSSACGPSRQCGPWQLSSCGLAQCQARASL